MKKIILLLISLLNLSACSSPKVDEGVFTGAVSYEASRDAALSYCEHNTSKSNFKHYKEIANEIYLKSTVLDINYKDFNSENDNAKELYFDAFFYKFFMKFYFNSDNNQTEIIDVYFAKKTDMVYIADGMNEKVLSYEDTGSIYWDKAQKYFYEEMNRVLNPSLFK